MLHYVCYNFEVEDDTLDANSPVTSPKFIQSLASGAAGFSLFAFMETNGLAFGNNSSDPSVRYLVGFLSSPAPRPRDQRQILRLLLLSTQDQR